LSFLPSSKPEQAEFERPDLSYFWLFGESCG